MKVTAQHSTKSVGLSAPWIIYFREVEALFAQDPEVKVLMDEDEYELSIYVDSPVKAEAIQMLLPDEKVFGNVILKISVIPADKEPTKVELIRRAFAGNPALRKIVPAHLVVAPVDYVLFEKKVVQYYSDDASDLHGLTSTLYQEIAKDVIGEEADLYFCTSTED